MTTPRANATPITCPYCQAKRLLVLGFTFACGTTQRLAKYGGTEVERGAKCKAVAAKRNGKIGAGK